MDVQGRSREVGWRPCLRPDVERDDPGASHSGVAGSFQRGQQGLSFSRNQPRTVGFSGPLDFHMDGSVSMSGVSQNVVSTNFAEKNRILPYLKSHPMA
jgi:hypothetical protein